jgi:hypothetical protein
VFQGFNGQLVQKSWVKTTYPAIFLLTYDQFSRYLTLLKGDGYFSGRISDIFWDFFLAQ